MESSATTVALYTDGSCPDNRVGLPGGWAALLRGEGLAELAPAPWRDLLVGEELCKAISGGDDETSNNRMELTAAIEGLATLPHPCTVELYSDAEYVVLGINENRKRNKNRDLWAALDREIARHHRVRFHCVRGHSDDPYNNAVDRLAQQAAARQRASKSPQ